MSTPLERQLLESHRQLLATYLGSLSPDQLRAAILNQASSGPEAMLASVHQLTYNHPNNPNNSKNSDKNAAEGALPINTEPTVTAQANQDSIATRAVGADQIMKEKERTDAIVQDQNADVDDDDLVELIDDPRTRGNSRSTGRAPNRKNFAEADESELSDYEYQPSEDIDHGENEKTGSTAHGKKRKSRKSRGKGHGFSGLKVDYATLQKRQRMARIAFTAAFAEAYAWPASDAATFKAALLRSPAPTNDAIPYFLQFGSRGALTEFLAHNGPAIRARSAKYDLNMPVSVRERSLHPGGAAA